MKNSIGSSIQGIAVIIAVLFGLVSAAAGIVIISDTYQVLLGIIVIVAGLLFAAAIYYLMTGFGQLVKNSDIIAEHFKKLNAEESKDAEVNEQKRIETETAAARKKLSDASVPDDEYIDLTCPNCGEQLSFLKSALNDGSAQCPYCGFDINKDKI